MKKKSANSKPHDETAPPAVKIAGPAADPSAGNGHAEPIKPPAPEDLARIAATIAPWADNDEQIGQAIDKALKFYTAALLATPALPTTRSAWLEKYGSAEAYDTHMAQRLEPMCAKALEAQMKTALEFDPDTPHYKCPARKFLRTNGVEIQGSRPLIKNLQDCFGGEFGGERLAFFTVQKGRKTTYRLPLPLWQEFIAWKKEKRSAVKKRSWQTRNGGSDTGEMQK